MKSRQLVKKITRLWTKPKVKAVFNAVYGSHLPLEYPETAVNTTAHRQAPASPRLLQTAPPPEPDPRTPAPTTTNTSTLAAAAGLAALALPPRHAPPPS